MPRTSKNDPIADQVQDAVSEFVARIESIARQAAEEKFSAVMEQLGAAAPRKASPGATRAARSAKPGQAKKRSRVPTATVQKAVLEALGAADDPVGMRALRSATGYPPDKIRRALLDLLGNKTVQKKGEKAATVYWLGKGGSKKTAGKKATKKKTAKKATKKKGTKKKATPPKKPGKKK